MAQRISSPRRLRAQRRAHEVAIPSSDGSSVAERISIKVPMVWDEELGEWMLTSEAEETIEQTKARHMGLLLPHELLALRQRLGLSQQMIGDLLQIGAKTWTRWETGRQRPSRSMNILLRSLQAGFISPQQLLTLGVSCHDWSAEFVSLVVAGAQAVEPLALDLLRPNPPGASAPVEPLRVPA